jgi:hypothetical protein
VASAQEREAFDLTPTVKAKVVQLRALDQALETKKKRSKSQELEDQFAFECTARKLPPFARQYPFAKQMKRNWRFDFAWDLPRTTEHRPIKVAVEIEGLVMMPAMVMGKRQMIVMGRHASPTGIKEDMVKYNVATLLGWYVLRFDQTLLAKGFAIDLTMRVFHRMGYKVAS